MSLKRKFDLQFFGGLFGTKTSTKRIANRGPEPEALTNLRNGLSDIMSQNLSSFDTNSWQTAHNISTQALEQQGNLLNQIPDALSQNQSLADEIANIARTGNIPTEISDRLNSSVNQGLQSSMGSMLNNLGQRGVLNSSVTTAGTNQLSQAAADAFNRNYLTAYQSVLSELGQGLQGKQANTASLLSTLGAVGSIPGQAYEAVGAQLTPAYNFWKDWQNFYQNNDPYTTIVSEKPKGCITGDTLVTLEGGKVIPIAELKAEDKLQTWDFENGSLTSAPLTVLYKNNVPDGADIIRVELEDGTSIGVIYEHLFFDLTEGKFIAINSDNHDYVGHEFAKVNVEGKMVPMKVSKIYNDGKASETYGAQCSGYLNYLVGGLITGNDGQLGLCNQFIYDTEKMIYDAEKRAADLEKYGKLSYDVFDGVVSREFFENNHCDEFSVAFGKGLVRPEWLKAYFRKFNESILE